jgi:hypothetical protein
LGGALSAPLGKGFDGRNSWPVVEIHIRQVILGHGIVGLMLFVVLVTCVLLEGKKRRQKQEEF